MQQSDRAIELDLSGLTCTTRKYCGNCRDEDDAHAPSFAHGPLGLQYRKWTCEACGALTRLAA